MHQYAIRAVGYQIAHSRAILPATKAAPPASRRTLTLSHACLLLLLLQPYAIQPPSHMALFHLPGVNLNTLVTTPSMNVYHLYAPTPATKKP